VRASHCRRSRCDPPRPSGRRTCAHDTFCRRAAANLANEIARHATAADFPGDLDAILGA
jgi:hypothetical protein